LITVELGYLAEDATANHTITNNYFADIAAQEGTDNETIRIGSSEDQNKPARVVVRQNYFVRCNGENEIVSSKSSYNVFERNTFRQCDGALVLRHGHHATVAGNFFFGDGAENSGGIRVVDSHHVIKNNYLQDLKGTSWNAAFSILGGKKTSGGTDNGYQAVDGITVVHNSILNCNQSFLLNKSKGSRAPTGLIANNLVSSSSGPLVTENLAASKLIWKGNLLHGAATGADTAAVETDPQLDQRDGLLRPSVSGAAANAAVECDPVVATDIDGQARPETGADIGADEVSGATGGIASVPLDPSKVGVSFLRGDGPK
jgi:poly(beta-D-mannuronate) lyase